MLSIDPPAARDLMIYYELVSGYATENLDFKINSSNPLVVPKGAVGAGISFSILDDSIPGETYCRANFVLGTPGVPESFGLKLIRIEGDTAYISTEPEVIVIEDNDPIPPITLTLTWDSGDGTPGDVDLDLAQLNFAPGIFGGWKLLEVLSSHAGSEFEVADLSRAFVFPSEGQALTVPYMSGSSNNVTVKLVLSCPYGLLIDNSNSKTFEWTYTLADLVQIVDFGPGPWPPITNISNCLQPTTYRCNGIKILYSHGCPGITFN